MTEHELKTKQKILQTAQQMFFTQGYDKVSVNMIIEAIGIAKGTFYHHFRSKDELMIELSENFAKNMGVVLNEIIESDLNAIDKFNAIFEKGGMYKSDNKDFVFLMSKFYKNADNIKIINSMDKAIVKLAVRLYSQVITQGNNEGVFDVLDPESTAAYIIGIGITSREDTLDYVLKESVTKEDGLKMEKQLKSYETAIERLLAAPEGCLSIGGLEIIDRFRK